VYGHTDIKETDILNTKHQENNVFPQQQKLTFTGNKLSSFMC